MLDLGELIDCLPNRSKLENFLYKNLFVKYYMPLVEIKDFNALIDNRLFFDQPGKNKQRAHENVVKMSRNNDYTT